MVDIKELVHEIENCLHRLEKTEKRIAIASSYLKKTKNEKGAKKFQRTQSHYETVARREIDGLHSAVGTLGEEKRRLKGELTELEEKIELNEGRLIVEMEAKSAGMPDQAEITKLEDEKKSLEVAQKRLQELIGEASSALEKYEKASTRILGVKNQPKSRTMTPEGCAEQHHPNRELRRRSGPRGDIIEFWYCPLCGRILDSKEI